MEQGANRKRSASHASLYSEHREPNRRGTFSNRKPWASHHDHATLLRSPGPLESMLKTTTETGDIGLFSIKPSIPPATYHHAPRSRPRFGDANLLQASRTQVQQDRYYNETRTRNLSHRDTTSDILSLYGGSDYQPSWSTSLSPPNDNARRSYSMTTCSSRRIPSPRSFATSHHQPSVRVGQRPRSPFPYPTRLRRPGFRPSSPALTDHGSVDQARALETDGESQRAFHGSCRPMHSHSPRQLPPFPLYPETSRSSTPLLAKTPPSSYRFHSTPQKARAPTPPHLGPPQPRSRPMKGTPDDRHSRSASLTSIVEMYCQTPTLRKTADKPGSQGSYYYDYSEGYETDLTPQINIITPDGPISERAENNGQLKFIYGDKENGMTRSMSNKRKDITQNQFLRQGTNEATIPEEFDTSSPDSIPRSQATKDKVVVDDTHCLSTGTNSPRAPSTVPLPKITSSDSLEHPSADCPDDEGHISQPVHAIRSPSCHEFTGSSAGNQLPKSNTIGPVQFSDSHTRSRISQTSLKNWQFTFGPIVRDFSSLIPSFENIKRSPNSKTGDTHVPIEELKLLDGASEQDRSKAVESPGSECLATRIDKAREGSFQKHHRRTPATSAISVENTKTDNPSPESEASHTGTEIVSPEPVSPIRMLRVKNSIPQFMKALPHLPVETTKRSPESFTSGEDKAGGQFESNEMKSNNARVQPPKFRLRTTRSSTCSLDHVGEREPLGSTMSQLDLTVTTKPKLKVRVPRSPTKQWQSGAENTMLRSSAITQCNSLVDLEHCSRLDMFTNPCRLEEKFMPTRVPNYTDHGRESPVIDEPRIPESSTPSSDQFDLECNLPRRSEAPDHQRQQECQSEGMTLPMEEYNTLSVVSEAMANNHHGLRQKLSMFRLKIGGGRGPRVDRLTSPPTDFQTLIKSGRQVATDYESISVNQATSARSEKKSGRVKRWANGAKKVVRSYVRRAWDRSSHAST